MKIGIEPHQTKPQIPEVSTSCTRNELQLTNTAGDAPELIRKRDRPLLATVLSAACSEPALKFLTKGNLPSALGRRS